MITIQCKVDRVLFPKSFDQTDKNEPTWCVFTASYAEDGLQKTRMCKGMCPMLRHGDELTLIGELEETDKYGLQFKISAIQKNIPASSASISRFLHENINGIGKTTADRIVERFGDETISVIESAPEKLAEVQGISRRKAFDITNQMLSIHSSSEELLFFSSIGLSERTVGTVKSAIRERFKGTTDMIDYKKIISENPYSLIDDVKGIGFRKADDIAQRLGLPYDAPERIRAGIAFTIEEDVNTKGDIWVTADTLVATASDKKHLDLDKQLVEQTVLEMIADGSLVSDDNRIYLPKYMDDEKFIAKKLISIMNDKTFSEKYSDDYLEEIEKRENRFLDDGQKAAVRTSIENNCSVITGGPGTGKTTTLHVLLSYLEDVCGCTIHLAAPTGRAAKRMTEQTGRDSSTIHRMVLSPPDFKGGIGRSVLVVDESSMIDVFIMTMIMKMVDDSTKLIFVGDTDQLPSIGPGQILKDMISSGKIPCSRLTEIHRQSDDSTIVIAAHEIISGKAPSERATKDFFIAERESEEDSLRTVLNLIARTLPEKTGVKSSDIQVLSPMKSGLLGVTNLNRELQNLLNPASPEKEEVKVGEAMTMREGDKVIQTKNDYRIPCGGGYPDGVFNGEIGVVKRFMRDEGKLYCVVDFVSGNGTKTAFYDKLQMQELQLAYAITVHKSQGSEFRAVIIPAFRYMMPMICNRNLLYTAVTRARDYCVIVGQMSTVHKMVHNNKTAKRNTTLEKFIQEAV